MQAHQKLCDKAPPAMHQGAYNYANKSLAPQHQGKSYRHATLQQSATLQLLFRHTAEGMQHYTKHDRTQYAIEQIAKPSSA